jgi:hypothetical protein
MIFLAIAVTKMRRFIFSIAKLSSFIALAFVAGISPPASRAESMEPGYKLLVRAEIPGRHKITFSKSGMKAENLAGGYSIITKSPDWNVTIANVRTKKYIIVPRNKFKGGVSSQLYQTDRDELQNGKWIKVSTEKVRSRIVGKYTMIPRQMKSNPKRGGNIIKQANIMVYQDVPIQPQILDVLGRIFYLPNVSGLPYWYDYTTDEALQRHCHAIDTDAFTESKINLKEYDMPKGLTLAKTEKDVYVDPLSKEVFDGFSDSSNLGGMGRLEK